MSKSDKKKPGLVPDEPPPGEPPPAKVKVKAKAMVTREVPRKRIVKKKRKASGSNRVVSAIANVATKGLRPMRDEESKQLRDFIGRVVSVVSEKAKQIVVAGDASERLLSILTKP